MKHILPELPFAKDALAPFISAETLEYHHDKHHRAYVDKLNKLIAGTPFETMALEDIVRRSDGAIFDNAAQAWNHSFLWSCLRPASKQASPPPALRAAIERDFGSFDQFLEKFRSAAAGVFGSGWAWLVWDRAGGGGKLTIETTGNARTPLAELGKTPLLTCDVWEHAYYLDYRNDRAKYLAQLPSVLNWEFVDGRLSEIIGPAYSAA